MLVASPSPLAGQLDGHLRRTRGKKSRAHKKEAGERNLEAHARTPYFWPDGGKSERQGSEGRRHSIRSAAVPCHTYYVPLACQFLSRSGPPTRATRGFLQHVAAAMDPTSLPPAKVVGLLTLSLVLLSDPHMSGGVMTTTLPLPGLCWLSHRRRSELARGRRRRRRCCTVGTTCVY